MSGITTWAGPEFPGAVTTLDTDIDADECAAFDTFEELVTRLQVTGHQATTIRFGRAYTVETKEIIDGLCIV